MFLPVILMVNPAGAMPHKSSYPGIFTAEHAETAEKEISCKKMKNTENYKIFNRMEF